jgi:hypothetical protein
MREIDTFRIENNKTPASFRADAPFGCYCSSVNRMCGVCAEKNDIREHFPMIEIEDDSEGEVN